MNTTIRTPLAPQGRAGKVRGHLLTSSRDTFRCPVGGTNTTNMITSSSMITGLSVSSRIRIVDVAFCLIMCGADASTSRPEDTAFRILSRGRTARHTSRQLGLHAHGSINRSVG